MFEPLENDGNDIHPNSGFPLLIPTAVSFVYCENLT